MNNEDWEIIRQHLENAIRETVDQFQKHPADFLSENDIQAVLFAKLRNEMRDRRMKYEAACQKDRCFGEPLEVSRVMTEYRLAIEGPFDIVVLCAEQDPEAAALWRQPCRVGIEIKFWQALERHNWEEPRGPQQDVDKLLRYWKQRNDMKHPFTGIAMLFTHPGAQRGPEMENIIGKEPEAKFPENGVAMHLVKKDGHWWSECSRLVDSGTGSLVGR